MELLQDWYKRTNMRLFDILLDIIKELRPTRVTKTSHSKEKVIPLVPRQEGGNVDPTLFKNQMTFEGMNNIGEDQARRIKSLSQEAVANPTISGGIQEVQNTTPTPNAIMTPTPNAAPLSSYAPQGFGDTPTTPITPSSPVTVGNEPWRIKSLGPVSKSDLWAQKGGARTGDELWRKKQMELGTYKPEATTPKKWKSYQDFLKSLKL